MTTLTIRNLDPPLKAKLRVRAAQHGRSMEKEVRHILATALAGEEPPPMPLGDRIHGRFAPLGGVDLNIPPRLVGRDPPDFGD